MNKNSHVREKRAVSHGWIMVRRNSRRGQCPHSVTSYLRARVGLHLIGRLQSRLQSYLSCARLVHPDSRTTRTDEDDPTVDANGNPNTPATHSIYPFTVGRVG